MALVSRGFVVGIVAGAALAWGALVWFPTADRRPALESPNLANEAAGASPQRRIVALGTIEPREGTIQIGSPLAGAAVHRILVQEGDQVAAGAVLIELADRAAQDELALAESLLREGEARRAAERALARDRVRAAELAQQQGSATDPLRRQEQEARLLALAAKLEQAQKELARGEELRRLPEPLLTELQVAALRGAVEAAAAEQRAARAADEHLREAARFAQQRAELELAASRAAEQRLEGETSLAPLQRRVEAARNHLDRLTLRAPSAATVLAIVARPGELVADRPLLQLADLSRLVCECEVDAAAVRSCSATPGKETPAVVRSPALGDWQARGRVVRIGNAAAAPVLRFADPRQPLDRTVARVVVELESPPAHPGAEAAVLIGLQVEVELTPEG